MGNTEVFFNEGSGIWLFTVMERNGLTCEWNLHRM